MSKPVWKARRLTRGIRKSKMATSTETTQEHYFRQANCYICDYYTWTDNMEEREEGIFYCERCASLPPYSDKLYNALVAFQHLFRAYFAKKAKACGDCKCLTLKTYDYYKDKEPICYECLHDALDEERQKMECPGCYENPCRCDDGSWWCDKCEGSWGCVCAEQEEDARLRRHRRICGFPACEGDCGTLDCGCIDKCKCDY